MNLLITGATGYVGSSFLRMYADKYDIRTFSMVRDDLKLLSLQKVDAVLHCAALVHQSKPLPYEKYEAVNTTYPLQLANMAKAQGVSHFVYISTIAVYGSNQTQVDEKTECLPTTFYAQSKLKTERQLQTLNDDNFTVSIVRPPMIYGKGAPGNMATLASMARLIRLLPFSRAENRRNFVYIGNLLNIIDTILTSKKTGTFLSCDDDTISTKQLVLAISKNQRFKIALFNPPFFTSILRNQKPELHEKLFGDFIVDNTESMAALAAKNPFSVNEGLQKTFGGNNL